MARLPEGFTPPTIEECEQAVRNVGLAMEELYEEQRLERTVRFQELLRLYPDRTPFELLEDTVTI